MSNHVTSSLVTVDGLVIGRREVGDSSAYIDVLTKEFGVVEVLVRGAKKINGGNLSCAALFTYSQFCISKRGLHYTLNSARVKYGFHKLSADIAALSLAAYFAETVRYVYQAEQPSGDALRLMLTALYELCEKRREYALIKAAFELRLSALLGLHPDLVACANCACYSGEMYLVVGDGLLLCADCFDFDMATGEVFELLPNVLKAARHSLYAPIDRVYKFALDGRDLREFAVIAEEYLLFHLGRGFKTLGYYKELTVDGE